MSRLTVLPSGARPDAGALGPCNFRDFGSWGLLTNDWGRWLMLDKPDFARVLSGKVGPDEPLYAELAARGFLRERMDFPELADAHQRLTSYRRTPGPSLHMIVVTLRCNQKCLYCHSSVVDPSRTDTDMDLETAKRTVDFIFNTPDPSICIEFQGGEPMLNWPIVKFITLYAQAKARAQKRRLIVALVNNFTLMNDERLRFLADRGVSICTSLDGPADLHNANRPFLGGGEAQQKVVGWLKDIMKRAEEDPTRKLYLPSALMTTTRLSLTRGREIVDVYRELGMDQIFLRALSPIGYAKRVWDQIGYEPEEFVRFYADTLDYILELNRSGRSQIMERYALVLLTKIVKGQDTGFMDLRWPAGAVLGCLAYNYDGRIFVSDEGRMVDHQGDPTFQVGRVTDSWQDVIDHPTARACVAASNLETQPMCAQCAYKPWCGVEPVFHYEMQGTVAGRLPDSPWCRAHMGVFDVLMQRLRDPGSREVFDRWLERDQCRWQENDPSAVPGQPTPEVAS
ncbi:MAG: His-Xaa-Ser system radical SAM maturase HxsB [Elusimicrobia bacterium]|nr:His-Xaa-Ser system radical SAM maturase HxsB [Elusimicrobiota bacterium]